MAKLESVIIGVLAAGLGLGVWMFKRQGEALHSAQVNLLLLNVFNQDQKDQASVDAAYNKFKKAQKEYTDAALANK